MGQDRLLGPKGLISAILKSGRPLSILLWGPPGTGKTSIARLYAEAFSMRFESLSAIFSGIADLKRLLQENYDTLFARGPILLFVDEIHRFNKAQQDAFLPFLESGRLVLVGATVENPSFYLNPALLSRMRVLPLEALDERALEKILERYEQIQGALPLEAPLRRHLIHLAHGDGRYLLNLIENLESVGQEELKNVEDLSHFLQQRPPLFDKESDQHYNLISALHKAVRGSDPDAALYWFNRIVIGGEDPLFIARRLIRMATEDVGLADPQALGLAIHARDAYQMLGSPEGELALAEVVVYLALAPKSNAIYVAQNQANAFARATHHLPPPMTILNGPTGLMKRLGYGRGYQYDHETPEGFSGQDYFPEGVARPSFYEPVERGFEREMKKRCIYFSNLRIRLQSGRSSPEERRRDRSEGLLERPAGSDESEG